MSFELTAAIRGVNCGGMAARVVLAALADHADNENGKCWPSLATLANWCNASLSTVQRAIKKLVELGLVRKKARYDKKYGQRSNVYWLSIKSAFKNEKNKPAKQNVDAAPTVTNPPGHSDIQNKSINRSKTTGNKQAQTKGVPDRFEPAPEHEAIAAKRGLNISAELEVFRKYNEKNYWPDWGEVFTRWLNAAKTPKKIKPKTRNAFNLTDIDYSKIPDGFNKPKGQRTAEIQGIPITEFIPGIEHHQQCIDRRLDINTVFLEFSRECKNCVSPDWGKKFTLWLARY